MMFKPQFLADLPVVGPVPAKAALIAVPVLIHPQMAQEHFPADPLLPGFERIYNALDEAMGEVAPEQSLVVLDRLISPAWLAKAALKDNELQTASMLVTGHCLEAEDPFFTLENWIVDDGIEASKSVLGFIVGAIYRQEEDPNPVVMLACDAWDGSGYRREIEAALSVGPSLLRHQVLAPAGAEQALMSGFEGLCRMHLQFHGAGASVHTDLRRDGLVVLEIGSGAACRQFLLDPAAMPMHRVETLLRRIHVLAPPGMSGPEVVH